MADDSVNYEVQFGVSVENAAQAEAEMKRLDKAAKELQASGDTTSEAFKGIGAQMSALLKHVQGLAGGNKKLRTEFASVNKELGTLVAGFNSTVSSASKTEKQFTDLKSTISSLAKDYEELRQKQTAASEAARIDSITDGARPEDLSREQRQAVLAVRDNDRVDYYAEVAKIEQGVVNAEKALERLRQTEESITFQQSIEGATKLEQATANLAKAERDYASAQATRQQDGSAANIQAEEQALKQLQSARQQFAAANTQLGNQQIAQEKRQRAEFESNVKARIAAENEASNQIAGNEQARRAQSEADRQRELASLKSDIQERSAAEQQSASEREQILASFARNEKARRDDETRDAALQAQARQQYHESEAAAKAKAAEEEQAANNRLTDSEENLAKARRQHEEALGQDGLQKDKRAKDTLKNANERLEKSQEDLNRAQKAYDDDGSVANANELARARDRVTEATRDATNAQKDFNSTIPAIEAQRYALYDVGRTALTAAGSIVAAGVGVTSAYASWETGMSNVAQTTGLFGGSVNQLEQDLLSLGTSMPVALSDIQDIAAMAGQLGIGEGLGDLEAQSAAIAEFTEQVSKFSTISGIAAPQAAETLAKLANLLGDSDYEAIASSIAQVEVTSAANTQDLFMMVRELGQLAPLMGLTTDEVVGLSGAFASMGQPAERTRSVLIQMSNAINESIAGINPERLQNMAAAMGYTVEQATELWATDPTQFVQRLAHGVSQTDNMTVALQSMGLEGARAQPLFAAMTENVDLFANSLHEAQKGYDSTEMYDQRYAEYMEDLATQWQIFLNRMQESFIRLGEIIGPIIIPILQEVGDAFSRFTDWLQTDIGQGVATVAIHLAMFTAAVSGVVGFLALMGGSMFGVQTVLKGLRSTLGSLSFAGLVKGLTGTAAAGPAAATGARRAGGGVLFLRNALLALGRATIVFGLLQVAFELLAWIIKDPELAMWQFLSVVLAVAQQITPAISVIGQAFVNMARVSHGVLEGVVQTVYGFVNGVIGAINTLFSAVGAPITIPQVDTSAFSGLLNDFAGMWDQYEAMIQPDTLARGVADMIALTDQKIAQLSRTRHRGMGDPFNMDSLMQQLDFLDGYDPFEDMGNGADNAGNSVNDLTGEVRTLVDYANDLTGVFDRAFELRFGVSDAADSVQSAIYDMQKQFDDAAKSVRDIRLSIRELKAEMQDTRASVVQLEYFLSIANEYGDTMRAQEIEAELAKLRAEQAKQAADLADKNAELAEANDETSKSLEGNSKQARANRKTVTDLVGLYQDQIAALAKSGMSQKELARESQRLKREFVRQLTQMGYNRSEVNRFAAAFDDMTYIIARVPRNVTVTANANPALQALAEFEAKMRSSMDRAARSAGGGVGRINRALGGIKTPSIGVDVANGYTAGYNLGSQIRSGVKSYMGKNPVLMEAYAKQGQKRYRVPGTNIELYSSGGFTGQGGKYEPAGIVHRGEYVVPKHGVNQSTGLPKPEYMNSLGQPYHGSRASYASGGYAGGGNSGIMVVELSAADRRAIANSKSPVNVFLDGDALARSGNAANLSMAGRGTN